MCDAAMKRIKREVEDYLGAPAAPAAPVAIRGRPASAGPRGTRTESNATKTLRSESRSRLIAQGFARPTVAQVSKVMSEIKRAEKKLSANSEALDKQRTEKYSEFKRLGDLIKRLEEKGEVKDKDGNTIEQLKAKRVIAQAEHKAIIEALEKRPTGKAALNAEKAAKAAVAAAKKAAAATSGGARRRSRSRRASRKQRKSRRSRRSMRR
jgi:hypothetical protein